MICPKHNCKMIQLFSSWACDECDGLVKEESFSLAANPIVNQPNVQPSQHLSTNIITNSVFIVPAQNCNPEMVYCTKCWMLPAMFVKKSSILEAWCSCGAIVHTFSNNKEYLMNDSKIYLAPGFGAFNIPRINFQLTCPTCNGLPVNTRYRLSDDFHVMECFLQHTWETKLISGQIFIEWMGNSKLYKFARQLENYHYKSIATL